MTPAIRDHLGNEFSIADSDLGDVVVSVLGYCMCHHRLDAGQDWWLL